MEKDQLTFNDLPNVVGELCDRIASMENLLTEKLSKQYETKENTHVPMTVQEACQKGRYSGYKTGKASLHLS